MAQKKDNATGKWMYYGSYVDITGKRIQYKKRGFASKKLARMAEDAFREKTNHPDVHMTLKELSDEYIIYSKKIVKSSSLVSNKEMAKKICDALGDKKIRELNRNNMQEYINMLDERYSKEYVKKIYYNLNKYFNYALEKNYLSVNPLKYVTMDSRKNEIKKEMLFWEPEHFNLFIKNVDDQLYNAVFSFLYYMGVRKGEMFALKWSDVDLKNKCVTINKTVSIKTGNIVSTPKTNNSYRNISMPNKLCDKLKLLKDRNSKIYDFSDDTYVFGCHNILPAETLRRKFIKYINLTNTLLNKENLPEIPIIRIHDLRHSHASYLINNMSAGFTDFDIAKRLGDTVSTLHSTYAHWFKSADKNIIDFMDNDI